VSVILPFFCVVLLFLLLCSYHTDDKDIRKFPASSGKRTVYLKAAYLVLCLIVISLNLVLISTDMTNPGNGWDFKVYMGASASVADGKDPYLLENIRHYSGLSLYFAYPPFTFLAFQPLFLLYNAGGGSLAFWYLLQILMLLAAALILVRMHGTADCLLLTTLLVSAFAAAHWNFLTGNAALVYLVLTALFFHFLVKERFRPAAVVMGIITAIPVFTAVFNGIFLVLKTSWRERIIVILISLGVTAAILLVSYCIAPDLFLSFLRLISSSASPAYEAGSRNTPTGWYLVLVLLGYAGITAPLLKSLALLFIAGVILASPLVFYRNNPADPVALYAYVFLVLFILMPRIKPYYFAMLIVPVYLLVRGADLKAKISAVALVCLLPAAGTIALWVRVAFLPATAVEYCQPISLVLFMIFLLVNPWDRGDRPKREKPDAWSRS